jgi:hypothetical protein
MSSNNQSLADLDRAHLLHPITEFRAHEKTGPRIFTGGKGIRLETEDGQTVIDGFSGLFNINVGHGRTEIAEAAASAHRFLSLPENSGRELDEKLLASFLYTRDQPDPDLLIRTSGEMRVSNFLLWQIAYAEIWVTEVLWPDFSCRHLLEALTDFQKRERRYGGLQAEGGPTARPDLLAPSR